MLNPSDRLNLVKRVCLTTAGLAQPLIGASASKAVGVPLGGFAMGKDYESRVLQDTAYWRAHIAARKGPPDENGCELWLGYTDSKGYGVFQAYGKRMRAPRAALTLKLGKPLGNLWALHTCDNRLCVKPEHLYAGNNSDNRRDMYARHPRYMTNAQIAAVQRLTQGGKMPAAIAQELGVGYSAVRAWRFRNGYAKPRPQRTPDKVRRAFAMRTAGKTYAAIGDALGIGGSTARRWLARTPRQLALE